MAEVLALESEPYFENCFEKALTRVVAFAKPSQGKVSMKRIYIGNLEFAATADQLRSLFVPHGNIETVTIVTDRDTGQGRGFAFVEITNDTEAENAIIDLDGTPFGGRKIIVN